PVAQIGRQPQLLHSGHTRVCCARRAFRRTCHSTFHSTFFYASRYNRSAVMNMRLFATVPALTLATLLAACSGFKSVDKAPQQAQLDLPDRFNLVAGTDTQQPVAAWWAQLDDEPLKHL